MVATGTPIPAPAAPAAAAPALTAAAAALQQVQPAEQTTATASPGDVAPVSTVTSACPQCGQATGPTLFCDGCGVLNSAPHAAAYRPGKGRALAAGLIDLVIIMTTLGVGWLVLLNFTAPSSETPGGQIAGLRVYRLDGQPASRARVNSTWPL